MGTENSHHPHPHHYFYHQRTTFLPFLCSRTSIKDVSLPQWRNHPFSNDPLFPRIGCMGQVKRHNKIAGFPISHRLNLTTKSNTSTTNISISPIVKYSKLKRLFSSKNLSSTTTTATTASSCGNRSKVTVNSADLPRKHKQSCRRNQNFVPISIENMDPPLPVIKRVQKEESQVDSLWKRRSGGAALKSLQLQQIHHPRYQHLQVTIV